VTEPLPVPFAPAVTVSHEALLVAVHEQPVVAVTAIVPLATPAGADWKRGVASNEQVVPACVTVKVWPPTVNVPVREFALVLAATV